MFAQCVKSILPYSLRSIIVYAIDAQGATETIEAWDISQWSPDAPLTMPLSLVWIGD